MERIGSLFPSRSHIRKSLSSLHRLMLNPFSHLLHCFLGQKQIFLAVAIPLAPILAAIFFHALFDNVYKFNLFLGAALVLGAYAATVIFGIYNFLIYYAISEPVMLIRSDDFSKKNGNAYWKLKRGQTAEVKGAFLHFIVFFIILTSCSTSPHLPKAATHRGKTYIQRRKNSR